MWWFSKKPFKVDIRKGFSEILYEEAGKRMLIDCELAREGSGYDLIAWNQTLGWQPPHDAEVLSIDDAQRIRSNIAHGLRRRVLWEG